MASVRMERSLDGALLLARAALGVYFFVAGLGKVRGELTDGLGSFARGPFAAMQPAWLPDVVATPYGYALPWIELVLGATLTLGVFGVASAGLTALVLLSIVVAQLFAGKLFTFAASWRGEGPPYHHSLVFLGLAVVLWLTGPGRYSVDGLWRKRKSTATN